MGNIGDSLNLPRTFAGPFARPQRVDIGRNASLVYSWPAAIDPLRVKLDRQMLTRFCGLWNAKPERLAAFACRYGPLGVTADGAASVGDRPDTEATAAWFKWAREAHAMYELGVACRAGAFPDPELREVLKAADLGVPWPVNRRVAGTVDRRTGQVASWADQRALAMHVNRWLTVGRVLPAFSWHESAEFPDWRITSPTLFGALAIALAGTLAGRLEAVPCYQCSMPFAPTRKPSPGRRSFCPTCRELKWPQLYAEQDRQQRARVKTRARRTAP